MTHVALRTYTAWKLRSRTQSDEGLEALVQTPKAY